MNFYTCCNRSYEDFAPLYAFCALWYNSDSLVEVGIEDLLGFRVRNGRSENLIREIFGAGRFLLRDVRWKTESGENTLPNTVRFVVPPIHRTDYVYICDVDIMIMERDIRKIHADHMARMDLPYSNSVRPNTTRMSGVHFSPWENLYPLPDISDLDLAKMNDEMVLFEIIRRKGLKILPDHWFRPIHGIHISPNRAPKTSRQNGREIPGWGIESFAQAYRQLCATPEFASLRACLSDRVTWCLGEIDRVVSEQRVRS